MMMNFLGAFNFTAPFMPWVLLAFSLLISGQVPLADLIGIATGHLYYYWKDVFPLIYRYSPLETPQILKSLINPRPLAVDLSPNRPPTAIAVTAANGNVVSPATTSVPGGKHSVPTQTVDFEKYEDVIKSSEDDKGKDPVDHGNPDEDDLGVGGASSFYGNTEKDHKD